ncbi:Excinuclease ABC subunit B, partial [hydrothermal vent metagenome]
MTSSNKKPDKKSADFSVDDFLGEIEKAEDIAAAKPLPQERLKNKRRLDKEQARRATTKTSFPDTATGISKRAPKSKANSVDRPTNLNGFSESPQAGFNHQPSSKAPTGGGAGDGSIATNGGANKRAGGAGQPVGATNSSLNPGVTATVAALANLIEHGRKEVEGTAPWAPHRPERPEKGEGEIALDLVTEYEPKGDQPTAIAELVAGINNGETDQVLLGVTGSGKTFTI